MGPLTADEIRLILEKLAEEKVASFDRFTVYARGHGYSQDPSIGKLQAKLSIMLEVVSKARG